MIFSCNSKAHLCFSSAWGCLVECQEREGEVLVGLLKMNQLEVSLWQQMSRCDQTSLFFVCLWRSLLACHEQGRHGCLESQLIFSASDRIKQSYLSILRNCFKIDFLKKIHKTR